MARQAGSVFIEGTIEDLTFYIVDGIGYVRRKSSLTGKRVKKDPKFARTMQSAERLKLGSQLASKVYRSLPKEEQVYKLFKQLKSIAILALKEGKEEAGVLLLLTTIVEPRSRKKKALVAKIKVGQRPARSSLVKPLFGKAPYRSSKEQWCKCAGRYQSCKEQVLQQA